MKNLENLEGCLFGSFAIVATLLIACFIIVGCATPKHITQLVRDVHTDTLYLSNIQYDSIYIMQDKLVDRSKDTIYIKDVSVEYRYKLLKDTIRAVERDSIPYQVTITEVKEITRPITFFDRLCRICFYFLSGILFVLLVKFVFKLKKTIL